MTVWEFTKSNFNNKPQETTSLNFSSIEFAAMSHHNPLFILNLDPQDQINSGPNIYKLKILPTSHFPNPYIPLYYNHVCGMNLLAKPNLWFESKGMKPASLNL